MVHASGRMLSVVLAVVLAMPGRPDEPPATWKVDRGDVVRTHPERGALEAVNQVDIVCNLRAPEPGKPAGVVRWVIDDGAVVRKGDRILQLDDLALRDAAREQSTVVAVKDAEARLAADAVKAATAAGRLDQTLARGKLELAELRLKTFQGNREGDTKKLHLRVSQAERRLELAKRKASEIKDADEAKLVVGIAEAELELARAELASDTQNTPLELQRLKAEVALAGQSVEAAVQQAETRQGAAEARHEELKAVLAAEKDKLAGIENEIARCGVVAPTDGLVVHAVAGPRAGGAVIAQGEPVSPGQKMLAVVDLKVMQARIHLPDALLPRLRALLKVGGGKATTATVRADALARTFPARLTAVAATPVVLDWLGEVRACPATLVLEGQVDGLKPGMTADVVLVLEERKGVLRVPADAVSWAVGKAACLVRSKEGVEKRAIEVGLAGDRFLEVRSGLREGEEVVLSTPAKGARGRDTPRARVMVGSVRPPVPPDAPRTFVARYGLTDDDIAQIRRLPGVTAAVPARTMPLDVRCGERTTQARLVATTAAFAAAESVNMAAGRFLLAEDGEQLRSVVVLGAVAAKELFPAADPIGETISVGRSLYRVVGVAEAVGRDVFLPLETFRARVGNTVVVRGAGARTAESVQLSSIAVTVAGPGREAATAEAIRELLRKSHKSVDYEVEVQR